MEKAYIILTFFFLPSFDQMSVFEHNFSLLHDLCVLSAYGNNILILS